MSNSQNNLVEYFLVIKYLASNPHGCSTVVFLLQELPDTPEVGQLEPAGFQTAGTRDAVTLTGNICQVVHSLNAEKKKKIQSHFN